MGVLFVTPEYKRPILGVLKNALDQASRPYGQSAWAGKPAGILGASPGPIGTAMAQQHLCNVLAYLDMPTDGLIDALGNIGEGSRAILQTWIDRFAEWIRRHN